MIHGNGDWGIGNGYITHNFLQTEPCLPACQPACGQMRVDFPKRHLLRTNELVNLFSLSSYSMAAFPLVSNLAALVPGEEACSAEREVASLSSRTS